MRKIKGLTKGMGIGGWMTNYKRFNVLPEERRLVITVGDMEHFRSYITERDVEYIASLGLDHIRVGFDQIVLEETPFVYRPEIIEILHNFVNWCKKHNIRPILNLHKAVGNYCDIKELCNLLGDKELQDRFVALWVKLEEEFHDDEDVVFELLNEMAGEDYQGWIDLSERTMNEIRKVNKTRLIVISGAFWGGPDGIDHIKVYDDENVIYTFHTYCPHEFTHQRGVLIPDTLYYNRVMPYPGDIEIYRDYQKFVFGKEDAYAEFDRMDIRYIRHSLESARRFIERNPDKVMWCGEFGTIRHINIKDRENWMRDMITCLKEMDVPYTVWNYLSTPNDGNRFSLVDDDSREILSEEMKKIIQGEV